MEVGVGTGEEDLHPEALEPLPVEAVRPHRQLAVGIEIVLGVRTTTRMNTSSAAPSPRGIQGFHLVFHGDRW